jgi:hypothetical protein
VDEDHSIIAKKIEEVNTCKEKNVKASKKKEANVSRSSISKLFFVTKDVFEKYDVQQEG